MKFLPKNKALQLIIASQLILAYPSFAQSNLNREKFQAELEHGIRQYEDGHYVQAIHTLEKFLADGGLPLEPERNMLAPQLETELARYYIVLSRIKYGSDDLETAAEQYLKETVNPVHRDRAAFLLAHHYFRNENYAAAVAHYDIIDIKNLNNEEIADLKFEQAYSYFVQSDFDKSYPLFAAIKEIEDHKYYYAGNYYYGLLAYHRKMYDAAVHSFSRIDALPEYKDIVPYYIAEIHYFKGEYDKVLSMAEKHIGQDPPLFYEKELRLLVGQVHFERKEYEKALPYLDFYYKNSDKIRKENLYELAFTNYQLGNFEDAINQFKPLSNAQDSMSQNSMYLMGDAYLKTGDKVGARNAFSIASGMNFLPEIKENAHFLYAKLSHELGDESLAAQSFSTFIEQYPQGKNTAEAKEKLVTLLSKGKNYKSAYNILSDMQINNANLRQIYQKVTLAQGLQLLRDEDETEAEKMLDESLLYPADPALLGVAQFWKAHLLYNKKDFEGSADMTEKFLKLSRTHGKKMRQISAEATAANAYNHLGYTRMELKEFEAAQQAFASAGNIPASQAGAQQASQQNTLLQADAAFMSKKYNEAAALYEKVIVSKSGDAPYASFQKALIVGIIGNETEKIELLQGVIKKYPNDPVREMAIDELGNTYLEQDKWAESRTQFELLLQASDKKLRSAAQYKIGHTYQKEGNYKEAIKSFEQFIVQNPTHPDRKNAVEALRACYLADENIEGFYAFTSEQNIDVSATSNKEQDYFELAENKYIEENYAEAIKSFDQFVTQFPNSKNLLQANFLKAESLTALKRYQEAAATYELVSAGGDKDYAPLAQLRLAQTYLELKDYDKAAENATRYLAQANEDEEKIAANTWLMKAFNKQGNTQKAAEVAEWLKPYADKLSAADRSEMETILAQKLVTQESYAEAQRKYQELAQGNTAVAAEARYRLAEILLRQGKLEEAETACDIAIKANQYDHYWMVKSYILIGEILAAQKDYFNARATLQSVVNNANHAELEAEAAALLKIVNEQEKQESKMIDSE